MINSKLPTWFVVKWLEKHPTHVARIGTEAFTVRIEERQITCREDGWTTDLCLRSDWTIYNERGKRVRFKRREPTMTVPPYGTLTMHSRIRIGEVLKALDNPLDIFVRERKS